MFAPLSHLSFRRLGLLGLLAASSGCLTPTIDVMPRVIDLEFDGSFSANNGTFPPLGANDLGTLGIEDDPGLFSPRVDFNSGRWNWTADWLGDNFDGVGQLTSSLVIDNVQFAAGNTVATDTELGIARLGTTYDFVEDPDTIIGLGAGVGLVRADTIIRDLGTGSFSETDQNGLAPHLLARLGHTIGAFEAQVLIGFFDFQLNDVDADYFDVDAFLRWRFRGRDEGITAALVIGYRFLESNSSYNEEDFDEEIEFDVQLRGPYLGFSVGF